MTKELKFPEICVVDASAGSGKTYALAKEYLSFLMNPAFNAENIPQKNILAITFTNKATNEMKQRILESLKKIALDSFSSEQEKKDILSGLGDIDRKTAQQRAYSIIDTIIKHYDFFRVQTIDSFINSVIVGCSFSLDISSGFNIEKDYEPYLDYCLDDLIELSLRDTKIKDAFLEFINHYLFIEDNAAGWFPRQRMLEIIKTLFDCSNTYGLPFKKNNEIKSKDILDRKKEVFSLIQKLADILPEDVNGKFKNSVKKWDVSLFFIPPYFDKGKSVPMNKGGVCPEKVSKIWESIQKNLELIVEMEAFFKYSPYVTIYDLVLECFKIYVQKEDVLFLNELNKKAKSLFDSKSVTVPELYYRLATRFKHYLVDEFQDTSKLQWTNISPLVEEAVASGGSLFYVGDKKQAIYGFRGGDYRLFDEVKEYYKQHNIKEEILNKNYRSQKEIVQFNNRIFSQNNLQRFLQDYSSKEELLNTTHINEITAIFSESEQKYKDENTRGYVKVEQVQIEDKGQGEEVIREKFVKLVRSLKKREFDYRDICVLLRDNKDVELVTGWLLEQKDIPVESEKTLNIRGNFLVKELFSFLLFLHFLPDNISFVSFILGDIFVKALQGSAKIDRKKLQGFLFNIASTKRRDEKVLLYVKFRETFPQIWDEYIREFTARAGLVPLYEFVVSILSKYNVLKNFPHYQGFIMAFLELIKTQEQENCGLESFIDYFNTVEDTELFVNVTSSNSIKVMTVHKAKGLEFGVVIIPFLDINNTEMKKKISQGFVIYPGEKDLSIVKVHKGYCRNSALLEKMYINEVKKSIIEELNTAYVAFTRAKNELYILIPVKKEENIARLLIPETSAEYGEQGTYKEKKEKEPTVKEIPPSDYRDWMKLLDYEFADKFPMTDRSLVVRGDVVHYMLSSIDSITGTDIESILNKTVIETQRKFPFFTDISACRKIVTDIVSNQECKKLFSLPGKTVFNEKEVVDSAGNTKRIDKLVIGEKEVWVVDYKISEKESEEHRKQIVEYMRIVSEIYPDRKVRGFLLYATEENIALKEMT